MKFLVSAILMGSFLLTPIAKAGCLNSYEERIQNHVDKFSFNKDSNALSEAINKHDPFHDMKEKVYYNDGKGRGLGGSILFSTARVVGGTALGAGVGFSLPYIAAGLTVGVPLAAMGGGCVAGSVLLVPILLCVGAYYAAPSLWNAAGAIISSSAPLISTVAGAGLFGVRSLVLSANDTFHAVKIKKLYDAKSVIEAAKNRDILAFEKFYNTLDRDIRNKHNMSEIMKQITDADSQDLFCKGNKVATFKQVKHLINKDLLSQMVAFDDQAEVLEDEEILLLSFDEFVDPSLNQGATLDNSEKIAGKDIIEVEQRSISSIGATAVN